MHLNCGLCDLRFYPSPHPPNIHGLTCSLAHCPVFGVQRRLLGGGVNYIRRQMGSNMKQKKIWHWQKKKNFGDELNKIIFNEACGMNLISTHKKRKADYIGIGSILQSFETKYPWKKWFRKKLTVLGAGFMDKAIGFKKFSRRMDFKIVRGELTKGELEKLGYNMDGVALGDPGLFASHLLKDPMAKKYKLGIVPHFSDMESPIVWDLHKSIPDSILINILDDPMTVIKQIAQCECILASAMHGLIVADSFGIPNIWAENRFKTSKIEPHFKYHDYYSIYGLKDMKPVQFIDFKLDGVERIKENYRVDFIKIQKIKKRLGKINYK